MTAKFVPTIVRNAKSSMLNSAIARNALKEGVAEFDHAFRAIDKMGELVDSLEMLATTPDSRMTREARAERYATQREKAMTHAALVLNNARTDLANRRERLRNAAIEKSGLNGTYPQGEEVRRALRELPQKERDAAINEAVDRGDAWIVASVARFPDLLTGKTSLSKARLVDLFITGQSPELNEEMRAIEQAFEVLSFAEQSFTSEAERMSDPEAEERAAADAAAIAEAEAAFAKATGTAPADGA